MRDLRTGRVVHEVPTGDNPYREDLGIGRATDVVVKTDGAVAWIAEGKHGKEYGVYQVHALDSSGERTLAVGPEIDPGSLALAGSTLYWTQGGKPFSAPLS